MNCSWNFQQNIPFGSELFISFYASSLSSYQSWAQRTQVFHLHFAATDFARMRRKHDGLKARLTESNGCALRRFHFG